MLTAIINCNIWSTSTSLSLHRDKLKKSDRVWSGNSRGLSGPPYPLKNDRRQRSSLPALIPGTKSVLLLVKSLTTLILCGPNMTKVSGRSPLRLFQGKSRHLGMPQAQEQSERWRFSGKSHVSTKVLWPESFFQFAHFRDHVYTCASTPTAPNIFISTILVLSLQVNNYDFYGEKKWGERNGILQ